MKDFVVSNPNAQGRVCPSVVSGRVGKGVTLLVERVTKFVYTVPKDTPLGFIDGLNIRSISSMNNDPYVLNEIRVSWAAKLAGLEETIKKTTPLNAPQSERLKRLVFGGIEYEPVTRSLKLILTVVPEAGSPEKLEYLAVKS